MNAELFQKYVDRELTAADAAELKHLLQSDELAKRAFARHLLEEGLFVEAAGLLAEQLKLSRMEKTGRSTGQRFFSSKVVVPLALAASLAIVAGGVWFGLRTTGVSEPLGLRVTEATGEVQVVRVQGERENNQQPTANSQHPNGEGTAVKVVVGMEIRQGERVVVGNGGKVGLKYDGEATTIELLAATEAGFGAEKGAKRVKLAAGKLVCSAAPQKVPFEITTRHAVSRVVGTRFSLTAEDVKTTLAVTEGKVAMIHGENILEVKSGESATATDEGVKMEAVSQALIQGGRIWAWEGMGGNFTPVQVTAADSTPVSDVTAVAVGGNGTAGVALKSAGSVWNLGMAAEVGATASPIKLVPVKMADGTPFADVTAIAAGQNHTVALRKDRTVWAWGANSSGELGDGTTSPQPSPVRVPDLSDVIAIAASQHYTLALKADRTVWVWGGMFESPVISATEAEGRRKSDPVQVRQRDGQVLSDVIAISAGVSHAVALKKDRSVWTWGNNSYGQLGDGTPSFGVGAVQARLADGSALRDVIAISGGFQHTVALKADGSVWAWGSLGDTGNIGRQSCPVQVVAADGMAFDNISVITAGYLPYRILVVTRDGACWGWHGGQFGLSDDGKKTLRVQTKRMQELENVFTVAGGAGYTMALAK